MQQIKIANTNTPVLDVIRNRWSARAFSDREITTQELDTLFEAAGWAASANNEQPWEYVYAHRGTEAFDKLWACLMPGNQPWTKHAAVLIVSIARKTFEANGKENFWALHDLGMANANLFLQATSMHIYGHPMAGYDKAKLIETLQLGDNQYPGTMIALGYLGDAEQLEEPFKARELTARSRKPTAAFVQELP
jgi:nitroreductase